MEISIIYTTGAPLKAYLDKSEAEKEWRRLQDLDDYINYSVVTMSVEPLNKGNTNVCATDEQELIVEPKKIGSIKIKIIGREPAQR